MSPRGRGKSHQTRDHSASSSLRRDKKPLTSPLVNLQRAVGNRLMQRLINSGSPYPLASGSRVGAPQFLTRRLSQSLRESFDKTLAPVLDRVRIHTGPDAAHSARSFGARAYALGNDIMFGANAYAPQTPAGRRLIAHEVAHVVQQSLPSLPNASVAQAEIDARTFAQAAAQGAPARVAYATPRRPAFEKEAGVTPDVPPRGQVTVRFQGDAWYYWYNIEDAKESPDFLTLSIGNYLKDAFAGATDDTVTEFLKANPNIHFTGANPKTVPPQAKLFYNKIDPDLHRDATTWMAQHHPDMTPRRLVPGTRDIEQRGASDKPGGGEPEIEEVTVRGTHPNRPPKQEGEAKDDKEAGKGSAYGEKGGSPTGIIQYEPIGEMKLRPELPTYVAGSRLNARVFFDTGHPFRAALNIFPSHASFDWNVLKDGQPFDTNWVETGRIEYQIDLGDPGSYTISVKVTSSEFKDGKSLSLISPALRVISEAARQQEVFEQNYVDPADRDKPFKRDETTGFLATKPGFRALTVQEEIDGVDAQIGAIEQLKKDGKIDASDAQKYIDYFNEHRKHLEDIKKEVGNQPYFVRGTFLNREDSSSSPIQVFMNRTRRDRSEDGRAVVEVVLYDSTISSGEPQRHVGHGEAMASGGDPDGFVTAEMNAISEMAGHWKTYNDLPDGTLHVAVQTMEGSKPVREWVFDTLSGRKTVKRGLAVVAGVGGVVLLAASPFTGGATAPVGILILDAVVAGATITLVAASIEERLRTNTFHFDAHFVMDMTTLVTAFVGGAGALRGLSGATRTASNGMLIFNLAVGGFSFVMMSVATRNALDRTNAEYLARIQAASDPAEKARLEDERRKVLASIMGAACVSGGLILVATGIAAKHAIGGGDRKGTLGPDLGKAPANEPAPLETQAIGPVKPQPKIGAARDVSGAPSKVQGPTSPTKANMEAGTDLPAPKPKVDVGSDQTPPKPTAKLGTDQPVADVPPQKLPSAGDLAGEGQQTGDLPAIPPKTAEPGVQQDPDVGLADRGYKPKPGERTTTREQYRAGESARRWNKRIDEAIESLDEEQEGESLDVPRVKGGQSPRVGDKSVPGEPTRKLDVQDIPLKPGETPAQAMARVRTVIGKKISDHPLLEALWNKARAKVLSKETLTDQNYLELYEKTRKAFWRLVRRKENAAARKLLEDAGFGLGGGKSSAPLLKDVSPDIPDAEARISLDHVEEKGQGDNWQKALDADNLRFEFGMPNTTREIKQMRHPELREPQ
jgi:hypothetical protein